MKSRWAKRGKDSAKEVVALMPRIAVCPCLVKPDGAGRGSFSFLCCVKRSGYERTVKVGRVAFILPTSLQKIKLQRKVLAF